MIGQDLGKLEEESVYILREARKRFKKLCCLWSMGKDSTVTLALSRKAFFGKVPYPVIHIDNGVDFPQAYAFRKKLADEWGLDLIVERSHIKEEGISGVSCCGANKTGTLKSVLDREGFDGVIVSIRRDEHDSRAKERTFSPRTKDLDRADKEQPAGTWNFTSRMDESDHVRIHPLLQWTEIDVWRYVKQESLPLNPLYFSVDGKRYRSLGCTRCTVAVGSSAQSVDDVIEELRVTQIEERSGRAQDKEREQVMQRLRALGYM